MRDELAGCYENYNVGMQPCVNVSAESDRPAHWISGVVLSKKF
jgi:hypothetical protein